MEIKLGIADVAREISLETEASAEELGAQLKSALADDGILEITDTKGRKVLVPARRVGFIELGSAHARPVGFGAV
ncbi:DUF3107 domain-containing protein [Tessaracoccus oleiagri]|uniref:ATP-binding protein n=1 Tax=Tessaracoccus oleiagri TaxID=686624 RepID=A0A1G9MLF0_9ACTN|nr:DUF3107 domain-containing protein [Tessaracoccus oleiagri]SDL75102.1 Protein of unknown function [Tessaracoccus oleiagri]